MNITEIPKLAHCGISAEAFLDESGPAILLTQTEGIEDPSVALHPEQLRAICSHFGLTDDLEASRTIATLQRRLSRLAALIRHLSAFMAERSDRDHFDLSVEMAHVNALDNLAAEWCAEFELNDGNAESIDAPRRAFEAPSKAPAPQREVQPVQPNLTGM